MRRNFLVMLAVCAVMVFANQGFAYKINHYREEPGIRSEAMNRKVNLIPIAYAQVIVARHIGTERVSFPDIALVNEAGGAGFRPMYRMKCAAGSHGYEAEVDAVTGQVMTLRQEY